MTDATELELFAAARGGDRAALRALLERHGAKVYRFGLRMCRDAQDAEDVAQETLFALARGVQGLRGDASPSTWLYTVARSFCLKKRRLRAGAPSPSALADDALVARLADPGKDPAEALEGRELERAVERALGRLEPAAREVLVLRDVDGLSAAETAEVLGLTVQAVKSRLHRARAAVRADVAGALGDLAAGPRGADAPDRPACPDVLALFSRHLEGEIDAATCERMERHLAACPRCEGRCDALRRTLAACRRVGEAGAVPPPVREAVRRALAEAAPKS